MPIKHNYLYLRYSALVREALFVVPVLVAIYAGKGITLADFFLIEALFRVTLIAFQVPVSYLSDSTHRKTQLVVGGAVWALGQAVLWGGHGFWAVLGAEVLMGLGLVFIGANTDALLFESLAAQGQTHRHHAELSRQRSYGLWSSALATVAGGYAYAYHPGLPVALTFAGATFALLLTLGITEPPRLRRVAENPWADMLAVNRYILRGHPELLWLMLFPSLVGSVTIVMFWSVQPMMQLAGLAPEHMGLVLAAYFAVTGVWVRCAPRVAESFGHNAVFILAFTAVTLGALGMALMPGVWALPCYVVAGCSYYAADVLTKDLLHKRVESDIRASVMGAYMLIGRTTSIPMLMGAGWLAQHAGFTPTLLVTAAVAATMLAYPLTRLLRLPNKRAAAAQTC